MIFSIEDFSFDQIYDVCIVGSGPAGATVANELGGSGLRICVLESGKRKPTPFTDALREVESQGIEIKEYSRERVLGGASTTWAGLSSPFDAIDFERREWVPSSGWPISREELLPFYTAAQRYRFPSLEWFNGRQWDDVKRTGTFSPAWENLDEKVFLACAEPQNFGAEFLDVYRQEGTDLVLGASVLRLDGDGHSGVAREAIVGGSDGVLHSLKARIFVLAANGIENVRLLLNTTYSCKEGLGNERDQVGRYFMNHPKNYFGTIYLNRPVRELPAYFGFLYESYAGYFGLRLKESVQRAQRLLNSYVRFEPMFAWSDNPGVESLVFFTKRMKTFMRAFRNLNKRKVVSLRDYSETGDDSALQNDRKTVSDYLRMGMAIPGNLPAVARYLYFRLVDRADPGIRAIRLRNFMEMAPVPENRVVLSGKRDAFGQLIPRVMHRPSALDRRTMQEIHDVLAREIADGGWGEFKSQLQADAEPWPIDLDASHHMGGTRMGADPSVSVVDPNCRVHGCPNVYVAGASVFPTSGNANPTFTVVALSIRIAQHLKTRLATVSQP